MQKNRKHLFDAIFSKNLVFPNVLKNRYLFLLFTVPTAMVISIVPVASPALISRVDEKLDEKDMLLLESSATIV